MTTNGQDITLESDGVFADYEPPRDLLIGLPDGHSVLVTAAAASVTDEGTLSMVSREGTLLAFAAGRWTAMADPVRLTDKQAQRFFRSAANVPGPVVDIPTAAGFNDSVATPPDPPTIASVNTDADDSPVTVAHAAALIATANSVVAMLTASLESDTRMFSRMLSKLERIEAAVGKTHDAERLTPGDVMWLDGLKKLQGAFDSLAASVRSAVSPDDDTEGTR